MAHAARAAVESLLRARKLDVTLTASAPWTTARDVAPTGHDRLDAALGGGLPRGHLSEILGARSAGRTLLLNTVLAAAARRGEAVALVDPFDRFDPGSASLAGLDLAKLLWVRDTGNVDRGLKTMNLILQAGGFGVVAFDVADAPAPAVRQWPHTTWMRIARVIEGSQTVALLIGSSRTGRSPGGVTVMLETGQPVWTGAGERTRLLRSIALAPRIAGGR